MENNRNLNEANRQCKDRTAVTDNELELVNGGEGYGPYSVYVLKNGDTLSVIATLCHTTEAIIREINNLRDPVRLYKGNKLLVPYYE